VNILDGLRDRLRKATPLPKTPRTAGRIDVGAINDTIQHALASAGLDTQSGPIKGVTDTIRQALSTAGLNQHASNSGQRDTVIEGVASRVTAANTPAPQQRTPRARAHQATPASPALSGEFVSRAFTGDAGTRAYKLYIPASYSSALEPVALVVMLHGCTQSPDDFAAGTRMNLLAEQHGFLVVYPAQAANANGSRCWNWFRAEDQLRDRGEPSLIAGITRAVAADHRVDPRRIFVAGLSAGAAMAVILGATYPELYAAVGAHSGLPYGAAHDIPSAFGAMKGGQVKHRSLTGHAVPTIVFHGDRDHTVDATNGAAIVAQATVNRADTSSLRTSAHEGVAGGRTYRQTIHADVAGQPVVEEWVVRGAGHAWAGGSTDGSYTDATGPDASAEMIRFFHSQRPAGRA